MIKFINCDQTLDLRSSELRSGADRNLCAFEGDDDPDSFHLGYFCEGNLVSISTFHKKQKEGFHGTGFQLRGMVTRPDKQRKGIGKQLLIFSIVYLKELGADYIWCNSRKAAYKFYQDLGFEFVSEEFEVPGIGPHRVMYLKLK